MDDRGKAQASVCYAGQYQRHAVNGTPIKTYNTTCQQASLIGFEVDLRQTPAGHGATCPDRKESQRIRHSYKLKNVPDGSVQSDVLSLSLERKQKNRIRTFLNSEAALRIVVDIGGGSV